MYWGPVFAIIVMLMHEHLYHCDLQLKTAASQERIDRLEVQEKKGV